MSYRATCKNLARQRNKEATMRRYLTICNKEIHLGLLITLIVVSMMATVYALASYIFHQTLTVPGTAIKIYQSDGVTPIATDSTISGLWQWNSTANQFELEVIIKNTGTNDVTITFSHTAPSGWVVIYSGATTIAKGKNETAFIIAIPPSTVPGTEATFDITISAV
jgi:hypothetical protein